MYSEEHKKYLKEITKSNIIVRFTQVFVTLVVIFIWEFTTIKGIINPFIFSSPSRILTCFVDINFFPHIIITLIETLIAFFASIFLGLLISSILWSNNLLARIFDPFLSILNSLPKAALGPILIIWCGANIKSIIIMSLLISLFTCIINFYDSFKNTNIQMIILLKSFGADKFMILKKLIIPYNYKNIISTMKITSSMSLVDVIMGEMLVSKEGLEYLIVYSSQIFNLSLVIASIFILSIISYILYRIILLFENKVH